MGVSSGFYNATRLFSQKFSCFDDVIPGPLLFSIHNRRRRPVLSSPERPNGSFLYTLTRRKGGGVRGGVRGEREREKVETEEWRNCMRLQVS